MSRPSLLLAMRVISLRSRSSAPAGRCRPRWRDDCRSMRRRRTAHRTTRRRDRRKQRDQRIEHHAGREREQPVVHALLIGADDDVLPAAPGNVHRRGASRPRPGSRARRSCSDSGSCAGVGFGTCRSGGRRGCSRKHSSRRSRRRSARTAAANQETRFSTRDSGRRAHDGRPGRVDSESHHAGTPWNFGIQGPCKSAVFSPKFAIGFAERCATSVRALGNPRQRSTAESVLSGVQCSGKGCDFPAHVPSLPANSGLKSARARGNAPSARAEGRAARAFFCALCTPNQRAQCPSGPTSNRS